jgi:hypothetical protein
MEPCSNSSVDFKVTEGNGERGAERHAKIDL